MKIKRERIVFLLMGLILGFALGASILFWRQSLNWTYRVFDKTRQYISSLFKEDAHEEPVKVVKNSQNKKKKDKNLKSDSLSLQIDTTMAYYSDYELQPDDTLDFEANSELYDAINSGDEEPVLRDRMLSKKQVEAKQIVKTETRPGTNLDSLLIGGKAPKEEKHIFTVELWESPLNYKGYKKNRSQVVLFGVKSFDQFNLKLIRNDLYLAFSENFYYLENTEEFRNLIPINNTSIINQLREK